MNWWPIPVVVAAVAVLLAARRVPIHASTWVLPLAVGVVVLAVWHVLCVVTGTKIFPTPMETWLGLLALIQDATLWRFALASVFRVAWGFSAAALIGIPLGLWAGWGTRSFQALNPLIQGLRPISPIAWIPVAILWFGVGDLTAIFLIFISAFFPIVMGTMAAVRNIPVVHVRSAQNFGLSGLELFRHMVFPAALPQILIALRLALGIAWVVIVAAEMNGVNSGLGYLIVDARNMGMRYDLVVAGMLTVGLIGIGLDFLIRRMERFDEVRWGYSRS